ncbi:hypothetical protein IMG5_132990 [Ichthyophthirius multifiliis]|uniref:WD40-repeat-containing domain n=1 Tax=Ichthyophthirius multifiliis TaxID=5932 RepID=G0QWK5_ICHMU|nr:hypothetical protein IMG5_132990 [Ichthyophthirius multifiliis]EGR30400.1 hypothetical protein IMG5_132990 [Ichthyophthirius multifiliis]|eukprot:XP_004031987.1 hypothetical protein IMG5_132990 [Ichthyophthirius multifiliis]
MVQVPHNHYLYKYLENKKLKEQPLLIAFGSLDGYFRIFDINNMCPVYIFKGYYGGLNAISFENQNDEKFEKNPLVLFSMQDDSYILLNTHTNKYIRGIGHFSFVSRAVFSNPNKDVIRVVTGSYDGCISINDFLRSDIIQDSQSDFYQEDLPVIVKQNQQNDITVNIQNVQQVNNEGVGYLDGVGDYFITSSFDGCATLYKFKEKFEEEENNNETLNYDTQSKQSYQQQNNERFKTLEK